MTPSSEMPNKKSPSTQSTPFPISTQSKTKVVVETTSQRVTRSTEEVVVYNEIRSSLSAGNGSQESAHSKSTDNVVVYNEIRSSFAAGNGNQENAHSKSTDNVAVYNEIRSSLPTGNVTRESAHSKSTDNVAVYNEIRSSLPPGDGNQESAHSRSTDSIVVYNEIRSSLAAGNGNQESAQSKSTDNVVFYNEIQSPLPTNSDNTIRGTSHFNFSETSGISKIKTHERVNITPTDINTSKGVHQETFREEAKLPRDKTRFPTEKRVHKEDRAVAEVTSEFGVRMIITRQVGDNQPANEEEGYAEVDSNRGFINSCQAENSASSRNDSHQTNPSQQETQNKNKHESKMEAAGKTIEMRIIHKERSARNVSKELGNNRELSTNPFAQMTEIEGTEDTTGYLQPVQRDTLEPEAKVGRQQIMSPKDSKQEGNKTLGPTDGPVPMVDGDTLDQRSYTILTTDYDMHEYQRLEGDANNCEKGSVR